LFPRNTAYREQIVLKIDDVDFYYLSMPEVTTDADGSQDALLVRVTAGAHQGWGECEASPLTSIAAFVSPISHGACRPVADSVLGQRIDEVADIDRIAALVERHSMDLLQAAHTWSGIELALWDLLGKVRGEPVWRLLGFKRAGKKLPYASMLFGEDPNETFVRVKKASSDGFRAVKVGWGPIGQGRVEVDRDHFMAARQALGPDGQLMVDVGQVWREDVSSARLRLPALEAAKVTWLEEPFLANAFGAYGALAQQSSQVRLAGGEGAHNALLAESLIEFGRVGFIQIDCGRIGGIRPAKRVADYAAQRSVTYVNHTFTSHLALSASLQPYAGLVDHRICEYPVAPRSLARDITTNHLLIDQAGELSLPDAPGLGIEINESALQQYRVDVEILVNGRRLFKSPSRP
jgi:L-alanine-DL-glutamate epimerase-like enolase superfamily enzyme